MQLLFLFGFLSGLGCVFSSYPVAVPHRVGLQNHGDQYYSAIVRVNHQPYRVLLNTASYLFYLACDCGKGDVYGRYPESENVCQDVDHQVFSCDKSPTCRETRGRFNSTFVKGYASGYWVQDRVCLGDDTGRHCSPENQLFCCVSYADDYAMRKSCSGLFGLMWNFGDMSANPMARILERNECREEVFAFYLTDQGETRQSEFIFCGFDPTHYEGELKWFKIPRRSFNWDVQLSEVRYNGETVWTGDETVHFDTSTNDVYLPSKAANLIADDLEGPCDLTRYATITLVIGHEEFVLEPKDYLQINRDSSSCQKVIGGLPDGYRALGAAFMRKYYTVFDKGIGRVGLALRR